QGDVSAFLRDHRKCHAILRRYGREAGEAYDQRERKEGLQKSTPRAIWEQYTSCPICRADRLLRRQPDLRGGRLVHPHRDPFRRREHAVVETRRIPWQRALAAQRQSIVFARTHGVEFKPVVRPARSKTNESLAPQRRLQGYERDLAFRAPF